MKKPIAAMTDAMMMPVTSAAAVVAAIATIAPSPTAPAPTAAAAATALRAPSASSLRLAPPIVGVDHPLRFAADRVDQTRPVVMELPRVVADDPVLVLAAALGEVRGHALPLAEVGVDQPVDQLADLALDLLRRVGHDLLLEALLHRGSVQQVHDPADAHRVVEEVVAAVLHLSRMLSMSAMRNSKSRARSCW